MKKIASVVILIIIISSLSVSCSSKTGNREVLKIQTDKTDTIEIFYPRLSSLTPSEEQISNWQSYIRDKYGLKVKLVYTLLLLPYMRY